MISKIIFLSAVLSLSNAGTLVGDSSASQPCCVSARPARRLGNSHGRPAQRRPLRGTVDYNSESSSNGASDSESRHDGGYRGYVAPPRSPTPEVTYRNLLPGTLQDRIRNAIRKAIVETCTCTKTFGRSALNKDLAGMISDFTGVPDVNSRQIASHFRGKTYDYFQVYEIDQRTWKGTHHHGTNVYFDTYDGFGTAEIRITEPDSGRDLAVYRITDQAICYFDGDGYGYTEDDISYRVEGLLDDKGKPAILDITISKIESGVYCRKSDLKEMLRRYNIRYISKEDASASSSSSSSNR